MAPLFAFKFSLFAECKFSILIYMTNVQQLNQYAQDLIQTYPLSPEAVEVILYLVAKYEETDNQEINLQLVDDIKRSMDTTVGLDNLTYIP